MISCMTIEAGNCCKRSNSSGAFLKNQNYEFKKFTGWHSNLTIYSSLLLLLNFDLNSYWK